MLLASSVNQPRRIELSLPQSQFLTAKERYPCFCGGFGSGKSHALFTKILVDKIAHPKVDLLYGAPTYGLIRDIAYDRLENMLTEARLPYQLNKAEQVLKIEKYGKLLFRTLDRPERIVGFQVFRAYLDELDTMKQAIAQEAWLKIIARARQIDPDNTNATNQVAVATTPEGFSFVYHRWEKNKDPMYRLIRASSYSNKFLPKDYIDSLLKSYPPALVDAYIHGKFVNLKNKTVYSNFDRMRNHASVTPLPGEVLHVGMDFNVLNMSAVVHVLRDGAAFAVGEVTRGKDTPHMVEILKFRYQSSEDHHAIVVYPDASGRSTRSIDASKSDLQILRSAEFTVVARSKNPPIKDRVISMNAAFMDGEMNTRYYVNTDTCPEYTNALEQQCYDHNGMPSKELGDNIDDLNDAAGYFIYNKFPVIRRVFTQESINHY
jgi:hypothetical protein